MWPWIICNQTNLSPICSISFPETDHSHASINCFITHMRCAFKTKNKSTKYLTKKCKNIKKSKKLCFSELVFFRFSLSGVWLSVWEVTALWESYLFYFELAPEWGRKEVFQQIQFCNLCFPLKVTTSLFACTRPRESNGRIQWESKQAEKPMCNWKYWHQKKKQWTISWKVQRKSESVDPDDNIDRGVHWNCECNQKLGETCSKQSSEKVSIKTTEIDWKKTVPAKGKAKQTNSQR